MTESRASATPRFGFPVIRPAAAVLALAACGGLLAGCGDPYNPGHRAGSGALIGGGSGAAIGALAGGGRGAAIGALVGAATTPNRPSSYRNGY